MPRRVRVALVAALVVLLLAVGAVLGLRAWRAAGRTDLQVAMTMAPAGAQRFSFTDWDGVRRALGSGVDATSPYDGGDGVGAFLSQAFDRDLSSTSALITSAQALQEEYGFSPASVSWELFSQGASGAAVLLRLPDGTDVGALGDTWEGLGYTRPDEADGVWDGGEQVVAGIGDDLTVSPELQYLAVDAERLLLVASDTAGYADVAMRAAQGGGEVVGLDDGLGDVTAAVGETITASVYTGDNVCRALAMSQADDADQAEADALVAEAGVVDPLTAFATGALPGGDVLVAMGFATDDQARTNADTRARLARGPAVGQGGDFADRFTLRRASAEGSVVVLDLDPLPRTFVLSDLSSGPVLYATC